MTAPNSLPLILANINHVVCCILEKEMPSQDKWGSVRPGNEGTQSISDISRLLWGKRQMCLKAQCSFKEDIVTSHFTTEHEQTYKAANTYQLMRCKLSFCLSLEQLVHFATPYSNYSSFRWRQEVHKPMVLVRLRSSEQQKWSCAPCLTGLWCAKLVILYCKWISMTPAAHDWPTPFSPR